VGYDPLTPAFSRGAGAGGFRRGVARRGGISPWASAVIHGEVSSRSLSQFLSGRMPTFTDSLSDAVGCHGGWVAAVATCRA
jgi:hypothetical protein